MQTLGPYASLQNQDAIFTRPQACWAPGVCRALLERERKGGGAFAAPRAEAFSSSPGCTS